MIMVMFKRIVLFCISVCFYQGASASIISTAITAETYSVSYPEPDKGERVHDTGMEFASVLSRSQIYDTGVYALAYVEANALGFALLSMGKYKASAASGSAAISYQLENNSLVAQQFSLRFSPLSGYLKAYCADPENLFYEDTGSRLPCIGEDFAVSSYNARITLNDELIWSSMAEVRSGNNGVDVVTDGAVLGAFDAETHSYHWGTQWFELPLGVFDPNEQFNLVYSVDVLTDGVTNLQGATACEPFNCPYADNVALVDYGFRQLDDDNDSLFQFSSSALPVDVPPKLGAIFIGLFLLVGRLKKT